jgi:hypothetical protein
VVKSQRKEKEIPREVIRAIIRNEFKDIAREIFKKQIEEYFSNNKGSLIEEEK